MSRFAVILLSRQAVRPCGTTPWVAQTIRTVRWAKENGFGLISSIGIQTWELLTAAASNERMPLKLIVERRTYDDSTAQDRLLSDFGLQADQAELIALSSEPFGPRRDELALQMADVVLPVSIRDGGTMRELIKQAQGDGKEVVEQFVTTYSKRQARLAYEIGSAELNPVLDRLSSGRISHWTRCPGCAWPDERPVDYYSAIMHTDTYPRSAFETLRRILKAKRIIASTRHMPDNAATVSFTELAPSQLVPLMRWRARYSIMSFEPYGISFSLEAARAGGVLPAIYYERGRSTLSPAADLWRTQSIGAKTDWRREKEFRSRGDFSFDGIDPRDLIVYCRTSTEAEALTREFGVRVIPFGL